MEASSSTTPTILLGFTATRIGNEEVSVVFNQSLSKLVLGALVDVLCVVCDNRLGDCCTDSVNLCCDTTPLYTDTDVQTGELVLANNKDGLENLQAEGFWLNILDGLSIDLDKTPTLLGKGNSGCRLFPVRCNEVEETKTKRDLRKRFMTKSKSPSPQQLFEPYKETHDAVALDFQNYQDAVCKSANGVARCCL